MSYLFDFIKLIRVTVTGALDYISLIEYNFRFDLFDRIIKLASVDMSIDFISIKNVDIKIGFKQFKPQKLKLIKLGSEKYSIINSKDFLDVLPINFANLLACINFIEVLRYLIKVSNNFGPDF